MSILPIWAEYTQVKEQLAQRKSHASPPTLSPTAARCSLGVNLPSDFPSLKPSLFNSPSFSLSASFCGDIRSVATRSSALQDTVDKLKAEVKKLKSGAEHTKGKWGNEKLRGSVGTGKARKAKDKATQVIVAGRTGSQLVSCDISQSEIEKLAETTNRTSDVEDTLKLMGIQENPQVCSPALHISFEDEKPYEYLAERKGLSGWMLVTLQSGKLRTREKQVIRSSGTQHRDMHLSRAGISGGFRVFTCVPYPEVSERLLKVRGFGHCVKLSEGEVLCSDVTVTKRL